MVPIVASLKLCAATQWNSACSGVSNASAHKQHAGLSVIFILVRYALKRPCPVINDVYLSISLSMFLIPVKLADHSLTLVFSDDSQLLEAFLLTAFFVLDNESLNSTPASFLVVAFFASRSASSFNRMPVCAGTQFRQILQLRSICRRLILFLMLVECTYWRVQLFID